MIRWRAESLTSPCQSATCRPTIPQYLRRRSYKLLRSARNGETYSTEMPFHSSVSMRDKIGTPLGEITERESRVRKAFFRSLLVS